MGACLISGLELDQRSTEINTPLFGELHGLGNRVVDLSENFPRSRAVKKYLNDVMKLVWLTGRAGCSAKKLQLCGENEDKGKARI